MCFEDGVSKKVILCGLAACVGLLFPGALWTLIFMKIAVFHAIIHVAVTDAAQRLVVEAGFTGGFTQLFRKLMQGFEVVGRGGKLGFGGLKKLLITLIDQTGNLTADQNAGLGKETHPSIPSFFNSGGAVELLQEHAVLRAGSFQDVKSVLAKPIHGFFIGSFLSFFSHHPT